MTTATLAHRIATPRSLKIALTGVLVSLVIAYGYLQIQDIIYGPRLSLVATSGGETASETLTVAGISTDIATLSLNGRQIFTDADGNFSEEILLLDGYNVIELRATDRLKRSRTEHIEIVRHVPERAEAVARK